MQTTLHVVAPQRVRKRVQTHCPRRKFSIAETLKIALLSIICGLLLWQTMLINRKWEYKVEYIPDATYKTTLDKLGLERWEIIYARRVSNSVGATSDRKEYGYEVFVRRARWP